MGAWGTGIFSDDLALDVKEDYNTMLHYFDDDNEILEIMKKRYSETFELEDELSVFWYALAYSQWQKGRLDDETKSQALYYIDNPESDGNLTLWKEEKSLYNKRLKVLQELKNKINSPQPERKTYKLLQGVGAKFEIGDIVRYQLGENEYKKFIKKRGDDLTEKAIRDLRSVFDGTNIYMIKMYDEEYALDGLFDIEEARKRNLTGHYEYFAVLKNFKKEPLTQEELYSADIRFDRFIKFGNGEKRRQDCLVFELAAFTFLYDKIHVGDDFTDFKKYVKVDNDKQLVEKLIKEHSLNIGQQIEEKRNYHFYAGITYFPEYWICCAPIIYSIEYMCPEIADI